MRIVTNYILYLLLILISNFNNKIIDNNIVLNNNNSYNFILSIPCINLEEKVYGYNDKNNDVNKGIYLVKDYDFNTMNGSLILASHSGNSKISHFKNLHHLVTGDIVIVRKDKRVYYYKIINSFKISKNGKFRYKNLDKQIYLITCDKKNKNKQIVYTGKLIKILKKSSFF